MCGSKQGGGMGCFIVHPVAIKRPILCAKHLLFVV